MQLLTSIPVICLSCFSSQRETNHGIHECVSKHCTPHLLAQEPDDLSAEKADKKKAKKGQQESKESNEDDDEEEDNSGGGPPAQPRYFDLEAGIAKASRLGKMELATFKETLRKAMESAKATQYEVKKLPEWAQAMMSREVQILDNRAMAVQYLIKKSSVEFKDACTR